MADIWTPGDPTKIDLTLDGRDFDPLELRMEGVAAHGDTPFSMAIITQVNETLWQGGCMDGLRLPEEIVHVVSLYPWETYTYHDGVRSLLQVYMHDSEDQGFDQVEHIATWVNACLDDGPTLVHCQAGLNRSSLVAARALMLKGMSGSDAISLLREKRSPAVLCNRSFEEWLRAA